MWYLIAIIVIAFLAYRAKKLGYFDKKDNAEAGVVVGQGYPFPCVIEGTFTMPDHKTRIEARNISLINHGHKVTGNDAIDNAVLGGGSPDGGIWLSGSYHFEIDATGQRIDAVSWIKIFSDEKNSVTGGVTPAGVIGMASVAGVDITGEIVGASITGKVREGGNKHVHGVMSGTYRRV